MNVAMGGQLWKKPANAIAVDSVVIRALDLQLTGREFKSCDRRIAVYLPWASRSHAYVPSASEVTTVWCYIKFNNLFFNCTSLHFSTWIFSSLYCQIYYYRAVITEILCRYQSLQLRHLSWNWVGHRGHGSAIPPGRSNQVGSKVSLADSRGNASQGYTDVQTAFRIASDWTVKDRADSRFATFDPVPTAVVSTVHVRGGGVTYESGGEIEAAGRRVYGTDSQFDDDLCQHLTGHRYAPVLDAVVHCR